MKEFIPPQPPKSYRVTLELHKTALRLDTLLLAALKEQSDNLDLKNISRTQFKNLFNDGRIEIKGQRAKPTSKIVAGTTYVDILGY